MEAFRWISIIGIACIASGIGVILAADGEYEHNQPIIGWILIGIGLFITLTLLIIAFGTIPVLF